MYSLMMAAVVTAGTTTPGWGFCGCHGGFRGCHGCSGGCSGSYGCYGGSCAGGCYGCAGSGGGCYGYTGCPQFPIVPTQVPATGTKEKEKDTGTTKEASYPKQGRLLVQLPPDAKLFVDGREVNLTPEIRNVLTPELAPGRDYYYTLMVHAVRDGKPVEETRRVVVQAGRASPADFRDLGVARQELPSAKPARITVRIPEGARLYVDGVAKPVTGGRQTFNTPVLEPGKSYYYTFKAEFGQETQIPAETQRVIVEAGKDVAVSFTNQKLVLTAQR